MSISSINGYSNLSLVDFLTKNTDETENEQLSELSLLTTTATAAAKNAYSAAMQSTEGMDAIKRAIQEIAPDGGRVTFSMISDYRAELEEELTTLVKAGLLMAGADVNVEFKMLLNSSGEFEIQCDDPEQKALIEKFFAENEELVDQFEYIQALGNMERAQNSSTASSHRFYLDGVKSGLQSQAMDTFFTDMFSSGQVGYSSILADFGEDTEYFVGANYYV